MGSPPKRGLTFSPPSVTICVGKKAQWAGTSGGNGQADAAGLIEDLIAQLSRSRSLAAASDPVCGCAGGFCLAGKLRSGGERLLGPTGKRRP
jgi:hypothetical protein